MSVPTRILLHVPLEETAPSELAPRLRAPALPIITPRLELRAITSDDRAALGRYYSDPEVCRYLPFDPLDDAGLSARMERLIAATAPAEPDDRLALAVVEDDVLVGDLMLRLDAAHHPGAPPSIAELGWAFAPEVRGRGLATEAARALVDLAFTHYPLHRLMARLDPLNTASARLCERLGMRHEAHTREDFAETSGGWSDTAVYGLLRREWEAGRPA